MAVTISFAAGVSATAGTVAEQVELQDLNDHRVHPLEAGNARALVFFFARTDCPISNRYATEVRRLYDEFSGHGIRFWLVYPDPNESPAQIAKHLSDYQYRFGALRDPKHSLVHLTQAQVTPEAAVFVPKGGGVEMVYRGRIDDTYVSFGKARRAPTTRDLEKVLRAVVDGKPLVPATTRAVGCFIADMK